MFDDFQKIVVEKDLGPNLEEALFCIYKCGSYKDKPITKSIELKKAMRLIEQELGEMKE